MPTTAFSFLVHPSGNERWNVVDDFLSDTATIKPDWRLGASVLLARNSEATSRRHAEAFEQNAMFVVADPETQKLELPFAERGRGRNHQDYLRESSPRVNVTRFVENVLRAQVSNGRDILLSPWLVHGVTPSLRNLRATIAFADAAAVSPLAEERELWFGIQVTHNVLSDPALRHTFLDELVELPPNALYLRVQIEPPKGPRQYCDLEVVRGLRELVTALAANDVAIVLAQSGLLGWLMLPFGAVSFGAGTRASMQRTIALPTNGFGRQPLNWFFVPQLLGNALAEEMPRISRVTGYQPCTCPYCEGNLPSTGDGFDRERAGKHFLWWCARLANELNTGDPLTLVRQRLEAARVFWNQDPRLPAALDQRSHPQHLEDWIEAVS